jgi:hypothetical protein
MASRAATCLAAAYRHPAAAYRHPAAAYQPGDVPIGHAESPEFARDGA